MFYLFVLSMPMLAPKSTSMSAFTPTLTHATLFKPTSSSKLTSTYKSYFYIL